MYDMKGILHFVGIAPFASGFSEDEEDGKAASERGAALTTAEYLKLSLDMSVVAPVEGDVAADVSCRVGHAGVP